MTMPPTVSVAEAIEICPNEPLVGSVRVDGSKNATLPLAAAAATLGRPVHLGDVSQCEDVRTMLNLLRQCGYGIARAVTNPEEVVVQPISVGGPPPELPDAGSIRASYYLVPALPAFGEAASAYSTPCKAAAFRPSVTTTALTYSDPKTRGSLSSLSSVSCLA
ncbi:hypothetical protein ACIBI9_52645 [Nonomuraea sp. NPDC050451]|uniref:hypothetical protein n=1 Tax=Nonomuraea sp. NPDC050451 TaxID=3364364 RepID=UPI0037B587EA